MTRVFDTDEPENPHDLYGHEDGVPTPFRREERLPCALCGRSFPKSILNWLDECPRCTSGLGGSAA